MVEVKLPELGEEIKTAIVSCVYAKVGDHLQEGDDIVELTTDKATFNVSATRTGVLKKILIKEGDEVLIGQTLAFIE